MTTLQNNNNPLYGTTGTVLTSNGINIRPTFQGFSTGFVPYQPGEAYVATGIGHQQGPVVTLDTVNLDSTLVYVYPFLTNSTHSFISMGVLVNTGVAASTLTMGIYDTIGFGAGGNPLPNSESGALSTASSATIVSYTFASPVELIGGRTYWLALACSDNTVGFAGFAPGQDFDNGLHCNHVLATSNQHTIFSYAVAGAYSSTLPSPIIIFSGGGANNGTMAAVYLFS